MNVDKTYFGRYTIACKLVQIGINEWLVYKTKHFKDYPRMTSELLVSPFKEPNAFQVFS